jgi:hypothetical protein
MGHIMRLCASIDAEAGVFSPYRKKRVELDFETELYNDGTEEVACGVSR